MTLQSQSIRSSSVPRSSEALIRLRRRGQRRLVGVLLFAGLVGAGFVYLVYYRDGGTWLFSPRSASASDAMPSAGTSGPTADPLAGAPATPPAPVQRPAMDMEMTNRRQPTHVAATTPQPAQPGSTSTLIPKSPLPNESPLAGATNPPTTPGTRPGANPAAPVTAAPGTALRPLPSNTTQTPAAGTGAGPEVSGLPADLAAAMSAAERAVADRKPVEARAQLNKVLLDPRTDAKDRDGLRKWIAQLNQDLFFSPTVFAADPLAETYKVVSGDNLVRIARKQGSVSEPNIITRLNRLTNPNALQIGQSLKVVKGPFHAVVTKSAFRMDIYAGAAPSPSSLGASGLPDGAEPGWTYICSYMVGLGEKGATPIANFVVKDNKLVDPAWANPRTGEKFASNDPKNPIGERWLGLSGLDDKSKGFEKYGIHGTIQPESIGAEMSMGCVRMRAEDVEVVYDLLMPKVSVVKIVQ